MQQCNTPTDLRLTFVCGLAKQQSWCCCSCPPDDTMKKCATLIAPSATGRRVRSISLQDKWQRQKVNWPRIEVRVSLWKNLDFLINQAIGGVCSVVIKVVYKGRLLKWRDKFSDEWSHRTPTCPDKPTPGHFLSKWRLDYKYWLE